MSRRLALITDVSEEHIVSIIRVKRINKVLQLLVTANVVPYSLVLVTLMMEAMRSSETSVLTRSILRNIP
jgi:hypothetical protein